MRARPVIRPGRGWEQLLGLLAAVAAGAAGGYLIGGRSAGPPVTTEPAPVRSERITSLGRLEPAGKVVPVFGPPGDRIGKLYPVAPGTVLKAGTPVAELASRRDRLLELQIAETQQHEANESLRYARVAGEQRVRAAQAELSQAKANRASDLAAIDAKLAYLRLQADTAAAGLARLERLRAGGVRVADEDLEKAKLLAAQAQAELKATEALRAKTDTTYQEAEKTAEAKIAAARADLEEAVAKVPVRSTEEKLALARQLTDGTVIKAPISGTVLKVVGREGQPTGLEPILYLADLSAMTALAEVYESDVGRLAAWVKAGPVRAEVRNPALPTPLTGVVRSDEDISRMIARNQVFALGPREDVDRRVVEVTVHLDPESSAAAARFVGLQVSVTLEPQK
jgi:HlyD family secretion protein